MIERIRQGREREPVEPKIVDRLNGDEVSSEQSRIVWAVSQRKFNLTFGLVGSFEVKINRR